MRGTGLVALGAGKSVTFGKAYIGKGSGEGRRIITAERPAERAKAAVRPVSGQDPGFLLAVSMTTALELAGRSNRTDGERDYCGSACRPPQQW